MSKVFISYRVADTRPTAGRLADDLRRTFGDETVFLEYRNLDLGDEWPERLRKEVSSATVVIVLIGKSWLTVQNDYGRRRLDDEDDWVRNEVASGLSGTGKILPLLVNDAEPIPTAALKTLPDIVELANKQARPLRDVDWDTDYAHLVGWLKKQGFEPATPAVEEASKPTGQSTSTVSQPGTPLEIEQYKTSVESLHANIEMAGFKTRLRVPIDLEELYIPLEANIDLRGGGEAEFADATDAEEQLGVATDNRGIPLITALSESKKRKRQGIVILGDPGSGKTTHLKRLLLMCLRESGSALGLEPDALPVLLLLRNLSDLSSGLDTFIENQLDQNPHLILPEGFGRSLMRRGRLLLLFDGLDEITDNEHRSKVAQWIEQFTQSHPTCISVITCRPRYSQYRFAYHRPQLTPSCS